MRKSARGSLPTAASGRAAAFRRLGARLLVAMAVVAAPTVVDAQAWAYPAFQPPRLTNREFNFGLADAGDAGTTLVFQWREGISPRTQLTGDLGFADPGPVRHRYLLDPPPPQCALQDHFKRPAKTPIAHVEVEQSLPLDGPHRAQIGDVGSGAPPDLSCQDPVGLARMPRPGTGLRCAGTHQQVGGTVKNWRADTIQIHRVEAGVGVHKGDN